MAARPEQDQLTGKDLGTMVATKSSAGKAATTASNSDVAEFSTAELDRVISEAQYREIDNFGDAIALVQDVYGVEIAQATEELGDGFERIDEKGKRALCGRPMLVMSWDFAQSETVTDDEGKPREYVTCRIVSQRSNGSVLKAVFSDGSTGIYQQLRSYTDRTGRKAGLMVPKGFRVSDFTYTDPKSGQKSPASTFYFDLSKEL